MERNRKRLFFLILILAGGGIIYLAGTQTARFLTESRSLFPFQEKDIKSLILTGSKGTQTIQQENGTWIIKNDDKKYRADEAKVTALLQALENLSEDTTVSKNRKKHAQFGIGKEKITAYTGKGQFTLFIGKLESTQNRFARLDSQEEVFIAQGWGAINPDDDFRDLRIHFIYNPAKIAFIQIEENGADTTLVLENKQWRIENKKINNRSVDYYLNDLANLTATDIVQAPPPSLIALPSLLITVREENNKKTLQFFKQDEKMYIAKSSDSPLYYKIPSVYVASLMKKEEDFSE